MPHYLLLHAACYHLAHITCTTRAGWWTHTQIPARTYASHRIYLDSGRFGWAGTTPYLPRTRADLIYLVDYTHAYTGLCATYGALKRFTTHRDLRVAGHGPATLV